MKQTVEDFSATSSEHVSLNSNKPKYPRGIINPNYPGFQHLAHTLAEHFVDHHQNQSNTQLGSMSDSDFSEVESDLSGDRRNSKNISQSDIENNCMNNNYICDDSNGNNIVNDNNNRSSIDLSQIEEILRTVFESNSSHLMTAIEMFNDKELDASEMMQTVISEDENDVECLDTVFGLTEEIDCDLDTYLKQYEDGVTVVQGMVKQNSPKSEHSSPDEPPPDILQKFNMIESRFDQSAEKPDILQNVNEKDSVVNATVTTTPSDKDGAGSTWSITPVDIVGNFEQEVEREFGLLVSGYKNANKHENDVNDEHASKKSSPTTTNGHMLNKVIKETEKTYTMNF